MGILDGFKSMFNYSDWLGTKQLKNQTKNLQALAKDVLTSNSAQPADNSNENQESFEEALKRLHLTEDDLRRREIDFKRFVVIFTLLSIGLFIYWIYLLIQKAWMPSIGTFGIFLVMVGQIFRYHFWLYQIHEKKLGTTFREWLRYLGGKP